ncbi:hypothetical protein G9A89_016416 [Geosiphon pyriformis]|nr:hypothetical protein G9A89_016416 [Geosiphon pyriformis]
MFIKLSNLPTPPPTEKKPVGDFTDLCKLLESINICEAKDVVSKTSNQLSISGSRNECGCQCQPRIIKKSSFRMTPKSTRINSRPYVRTAGGVLNNPKDNSLSRDPRLKRERLPGHVQDYIDKQQKKEKDLVKEAQVLVDRFNRQLNYACYELPTILHLNPQNLEWLSQQYDSLQQLLSVVRAVKWSRWQYLLEWVMEGIQQQQEHVEQELLRKSCK